MMLEIILTSSVLILIIMLLRAFCRKSIKPTLRYALWLVVAVRLVLPFSLFSSNASVMNFFGKAGMVDSPASSADNNLSAPSDIVNDVPEIDAPDDAYVPENQGVPEVLPPLGEGYIDPTSTSDPANQSAPASPTNPIIPTEQDSDIAPPVQEDFPQQSVPEHAQAPTTPIEPVENESVQPPAIPESTAPEKNQPSLSIALLGRSFEIRSWLINAAKAVWLTVAAAMGIWFLGVNIAFGASLRKNRRELDVNAPLKVYALPSLDSPCLFGLFRPAVYINESAAENKASLRFVLAHEYCHYRHGDMFWSLLRCILVSVYWFNPLVWAAAYLSKRDCECSCDEAAIKLLGEPLRIDYGKALVSMIPERRADPRLIGVASTSMSGSKRAVRERVRLIAKKPKNTVIAVVLVIAVLAAAVGCTFTSADDGKDKDLPEIDAGADAADSEVKTDKPEDKDTAEPDDSEDATGIRLEKYDSQELNSLRLAGTKPFILPFTTASGVEDCWIYVNYDGDKPLGVSEYPSFDSNRLSIIASGGDYCYIYNIADLQIYYYNVTTGETTPLLSDSYKGHTKEEFLKHFEQFKSSDYDDTYRQMWLSPHTYSISSDCKWLTYTSSKWVENGEVSAVDHRWLHNIETGEELIAEDLLASAIGENARFCILLSDNKLLAEIAEPDGAISYAIVDIITKEVNEILKAPLGTFSYAVSEKYILTFDGDADVYDITTGKTHSFEIGVEDYDFSSLSLSQCNGDCLAISPNSGVAYVIDLQRDEIKDFLPPDSRYNIRIATVYEDRVHFEVYDRHSDERYGSFVARTAIQPEPIDTDTELKLYSRHVEYSAPEYQKFIPEVYDLTPIYGILGEEAADRATAEYYKLDMNERQSIPPLYRLIRDTGITREQLEAYNKTAENKLSDKVIESLYYPYDTMACEAFAGELSMFYNGKAYSLGEAISYLATVLPGNSSIAFREDILPYWRYYARGGSVKDIEAAHKVVEKYLEDLKSGESLENYPVTDTEYQMNYISEKSYTNEPEAIEIETCNPNTEQGIARWQEINSDNAYSTYYLPIEIDGRTVDCEIKTVSAGTGKIADISYRALGTGLGIFGEGAESCYITDTLKQKIYRFDVATAECTQVLSLTESGNFIEAPAHYEHIPGSNYNARYPLQVSPDGKWLLYRSDKWLKKNIKPSEKYHTWLYNLETGDELLFDDIAIYVSGYKRQFEYLLADNKILVSAEMPDGSTGYSIVDILTKEANNLLSVPNGVDSFAASQDYIFYFTDRETTQIEVYGIADGSIHRFRFNSPIVSVYSAQCLGKCLVLRTYDSGIIVMNLECDTAVNLIVPDNLELGCMVYELISDGLVLIEESDSYSDYANIVVRTGLETEARGTSLAGRMHGRHVEYTAKEYQKFIPEAYDLTPIYEILGEEKAASEVADYYTIPCEERQSLPPLYRLIKSSGITKEQLNKYNETAENKLADDVIDALYLDSAQVKKALLAETSLLYDGKAYSLREAIVKDFPYNVMAEYINSIEGYVQRNCSNYWISLVEGTKEHYAEAVKAANPKVGDTIYSFNKIASQGKQATTYRIDVVFTGRDRHQSSSSNDTTIWGEFELRAFDKNGKQTGSVKLYSDVVNQYGAIGLDTKKLLGSFITDAADNVIVFAMPNGNIKEGAYDATIYGITFSGELFMYEIEDSEDFIYISSNAGAKPINRISANTVIVSDLNGDLRPHFDGDSDDTKYLCDFYSDNGFRAISFYRLDDKNHKMIPYIFIDGHYVKYIADPVISELKTDVSRALCVKTSENEAYVYYVIGEGYVYDKDSGVYYRKAVADENDEWQAVGETMRVKSQADVAKWFQPIIEPAEDGQEENDELPAVTMASVEPPAEPPKPESTTTVKADSKYTQWFIATQDVSAQPSIESKLTKVEVPKGIELVNRLASGKWFAYDRRQSFPDTGINAECIYNPANGEVEKIKVPDDFPGWLYGSTDAFVGRRYLYYWLSYSDETEKLTAIDFEEHTAEVIYSYGWDEYNWHDVYAIDDNSYISCLTKLETVGTETAYSVKSELRGTDGSAIPLPETLYIDNGKNSRGLFPRCFFSDNGSIRALCEQRVNKAVRYYICDFSREGKYLGRTKLNGIEHLTGEGRVSSCVKAGDYAFINGSHLVKLSGGEATHILSRGGNTLTVFNQDKFVYCDFGDTVIYIYDLKANVLSMLDLKAEIADFDSSDFYYLSISDIGNGELLVGINKWKNPNEYYILSDY